MTASNAELPLAIVTLLGIGVFGCGSQSDATMPKSARLLLEAKQAIADGDDAAGLTALNSSIACQPTTWALIERAKLNARRSNDEAARSDCQQLRELDPDNRDAAWIEGELKKPVAKRFEGQAATGPSSRK